jgi:hypothetical protein
MRAKPKSEEAPRSGPTIEKFSFLPSLIMGIKRFEPEIGLPPFWALEFDATYSF